MILSNSKNTNWIVSCVIWKQTKNGHPPIITHCDSRSFRSEENTKNRYYAIVDSLEQAGYSISELSIFNGKKCEGIRAFNNIGNSAVVFIDRNPIWHR